MNLKKHGVSFLLGAALWFTGSPASAQLMDDIEIISRDNTAEIRIKLSVPVRYLRHFPKEQGELINIYFQVTSMDSMDRPLREEHRKSPPNQLVPSFTVTSTSLGATDVVRDPPYLAIQFSRPVKYKIRQSDDYRDFILTVPLPEPEKKPLPSEKTSGNGPAH